MDGRREDGAAGQASVELIAVLPLLGLALLVCVQIAVAAHTGWAAGIAARAGARAELVGGDGRAAARAALPPALREGAELRRTGGAFSVDAPVPRILPGLPRVTVGSSTSLAGHG